MWLIEGWAVDAYNSWFGSRDIVLMANAKVVSELKKYLYYERKYKKDKGVDGVMHYYKLVGNEHIEIDIVKNNQKFQGIDDVMNINFSPENSVSLSMKNNATIIVPERSILLGMKIKAVWDRNCMLKVGKYYNRSYLLDKITKDYGYIIALLDDGQIRNHPLNLQYLHDKTFSKSYLKNLLKSLTLQDLQYRSLSSRDCKELIDKLLSLV
jgi:hypothetical protein